MIMSLSPSIQHSEITMLGYLLIGYCSYRFRHAVDPLGLLDHRTNRVVTRFKFGSEKVGFLFRCLIVDHCECHPLAFIWILASQRWQLLCAWWPRPGHRTSLGYQRAGHTCDPLRHKARQGGTEREICR